FYGRNLNAWIDCLSSMDAPEDGLTAVHAPPGGIVLLNLLHMRDLAGRCPDVYKVIIEDTAFINFRKVELGQPPLLCLAFYDSDDI
ncbi:MAG: barstar family protein, partial [Rhodospirillales bacterium]|nr:barstar family protein [Acetobacter sp.]